MNLSLENINNTVKNELPNYMEIQEAVLLDSTNSGPAIYSASLKSKANSSKDEDCGIGYDIQSKLRKFWSSSQLLISLKLNGPE